MACIRIASLLEFFYLLFLLSVAPLVMASGSDSTEETRRLWEAATVDDEASRQAMRMWDTGLAEPDGPADSDPMEAL